MKTEETGNRTKTIGKKKLKPKIKTNRRRCSAKRISSLSCPMSLAQRSIQKSCAINLVDPKELVPF